MPIAQRLLLVTGWIVFVGHCRRVDAAAKQFDSLFFKRNQRTHAVVRPQTHAASKTDENTIVESTAPSLNAFTTLLLSVSSAPLGQRTHSVSRPSAGVVASSHIGRRHNVPSMLSSGDLSEFADMATSASSVLPSVDLSQFSDLAKGFGINSIKAFALYKAYLAFPRGRITEGLPFAIRPSGAPNAGEGLFTRKFLPQGYVLGAYVGRLLSNSDYQKKVQQYPKTTAYCWVLSSGMVLDPTDDRGNLLSQVSWVDPVPNLLSKPFFSQPTTLSYINEPPRGADTNIVIEESGFDGTEVRFIASRNIMQGEEFFVDYGPTYDRSHYGRNDELLEKL